MNNLYLPFSSIFLILILNILSQAQPLTFKLYQNEPNPFDTTGTSIRYDLPKSCHNKLWIESVTGSLVKTLVNGQYAAGYHQVLWDARNENGDFISTGSYLGKMLAISSNDTLFRDMISMQFQVHLEPFTDIQAGLLGLNCGSVTWGDYDNDNDLDILLTGTQGSFNHGAPYTKIYRNDDSNFIDTKAPLIGVRNSAIAWGDYDNDGDLDILLTGYSESAGPVSRIYRNDGAIFVDIQAALVGVEKGAVDWGDYDNDGDLDILLTGTFDDATEAAIVYRNDAGEFVDIDAGLDGVWWSAAAWGDYDSDGDLDILLAGTYNFFFIARIYRNDDGQFHDLHAALEGVGGSAAAWGDYDSDSDLDFILTGDGNLGNRIASIYRNDNHSFTEMDFGLTGASFGSANWGDYDNDGDLDILLTGFNAITDAIAITKVYRNENSSFTDIHAELPGVRNSDAAWGDYDNDGDLDLLLTGNSEAGKITRIYRNNSAADNAAPNTPSNLLSLTQGSSVKLNWQPASDNQTPSALTYNLCVGITPYGCEIMTPMADLRTGLLRLPRLGNTYHRTTWTLKNLPVGSYYWSVQAIDPAFAGSAFAPEQTFTITTTDIMIDENNLPASLRLDQNYPNPFNPTTTIRYTLPQPEFVKLEIYNTLGKKVATLVDTPQNAGDYSIRWQPTHLASGVYVYRLQAGDFYITKKLVLLK